MNHDCVKAPSAGPYSRVAEDVSGINPRQRLDESSPRCFDSLTLSALRGGDAHQPMQLNRLRRDGWIALVGDCLSVDEREGAQRRDSFVEPFVGELRRQRLAELLACVGEQKQRDWLCR